MIHSQVFFTVETDVPSVTPPFKKKKIDSFWVKTKKDNTKDIIEAAKNKALKCYGIEISNIDAPDGNRFGEERRLK